REQRRGLPDGARRVGRSQAGPDSGRRRSIGRLTMSADRAVLRAPCEPCGSRGRVLAQMHDERIRLMSLVVRTYRHLTDNLARELDQAVGIPPVFFDVLLHVAAAPRNRQTMSRLSEEVALTKGGMTRLVDHMVEAGLVVRENSSSDRRSIHVARTGVGHEIL